MHYRDGGWTHVDALEEVQMHAERVGQDRFDDVAVAYCHPYGSRPVTGFEGSVMAPDCRH
jgi:hypothetical protein